jgi:hypothetical protein
MKASQVFRVIWRINAVLILVASGLAALGLAALVIGEMGLTRWGGSAGVDKPLQVQAASGRTLALGQFQIVSGTNIARAYLAAKAPERMASSSGSGETRNILFIDLSSGETSWLFPSHEQELSREEELFAPAPPEPRSTLLATLYLVRPVGSAPEAAGRLFLVSPSGRRTAELAVGVTSVPASFVKSPSEATLLIERSGTHALLPVDLTSFAKQPESSLSIPTLTQSSR